MQGFAITIRGECPPLLCGSGVGGVPLVLVFLIAGIIVVIPLIHAAVVHRHVGSPAPAAESKHFLLFGVRTVLCRLNDMYISTH